MILLNIILRFWKEFLIFLLILLSSVLFFFLSNSEDKHKKELELERSRYKEEKALIEKRHLDSLNKEIQKVQEYEKAQHQKTLDSLEKAKKREIELSKHISNTNDINDRLRNTIRTLNTEVSNSSREAESRLRIAQQVSFEQCTTALREVESDAIRLSNTVREFDERWPDQINKEGPYDNKNNTNYTKE